MKGNFEFQTMRNRKTTNKIGNISFTINTKTKNERPGKFTGILRYFLMMFESYCELLF